MPFRPIIVVTGNVSVEGGDHHSVRQKDVAENGSGVMQTLTHTREVTTDRKAANVVSTEYARRVRLLCVIKTPFGSLFDAADLAAVKDLISSATRAVAEFNTRVGAQATSRLTNALLWEHLRGNRLAAVEGWLARGVAERNEAVLQAAAALAALT